MKSTRGSHFRSTTPRLCFTALALISCSGEGDQTWVGGALDAGSELGSVRLLLAAAPAGAGCLNIDFQGNQRDERRQIELTPGQSVDTTFDGLPVGLVSIDAAAYDEQCRTVTGGDTPSWLLESPEVVRIERGSATDVSLHLIQNGVADVSVDWEAPAWVGESRGALTLAVIGDTPYGAAQIADHPNLVAKINADPAVSRAIHLGDIKNGSTRCDNEYFDLIFRDYSKFRVPLAYTPGDNEWTDCHRANNGAYDPLERLARVRQVFFGTPGLTLGAFAEVLPQSDFAGFEAYPENTIWFDAGVAFGLVHAIGSNNSTPPWYADDTTGTKQDNPAARDAERNARIRAGLAWIDELFELALAQKAAAVVLGMQADTFAGGAASSGFVDTIRSIAAHSRAFAKPVLLLQGDTHVYLTDKPLENGHAGYGVTEPVPNLTRIVVQGETTREYLRLKIDASTPSVFSWDRVQF
jgi:hypothetical protein